MENFRAYDAVSRDVVGRWTYPLCPDVNALPRGVRVEYRARGGFPPSYVERRAKVSTEAVVGEGVRRRRRRRGGGGRDARALGDRPRRDRPGRRPARRRVRHARRGHRRARRDPSRDGVRGAAVHADAVVGAGDSLARRRRRRGPPRRRRRARVARAPARRMRRRLRQRRGRAGGGKLQTRLAAGGRIPRVGTAPLHGILDGDGRRFRDSSRNDASPDESSADSARLDAERSALAAASAAARTSSPRTVGFGRPRASARAARGRPAPPRAGVGGGGAALRSGPADREAVREGVRRRRRAGLGRREGGGARAGRGADARVVAGE